MGRRERKEDRKEEGEEQEEEREVEPMEEKPRRWETLCPGWKDDIGLTHRESLLSPMGGWLLSRTQPYLQGDPTPAGKKGMNHKADANNCSLKEGRKASWRRQSLS